MSIPQPCARRSHKHPQLDNIPHMLAVYIQHKYISWKMLGLSLEYDQWSCKVCTASLFCWCCLFIRNVTFESIALHFVKAMIELLEKKISNKPFVASPFLGGFSTIIARTRVSNFSRGPVAAYPWQVQIQKNHKLEWKRQKCISLLLLRYRYNTKSLFKAESSLHLFSWWDLVSASPQGAVATRTPVKPQKFWANSFVRCEDEH